MKSIYSDDLGKVYVEYDVGLHVFTIAGGAPSDPRVIESWVRMNLGATTEDEINRLVAQTMIERGIVASEAAEEVAASTKLNGFKRDDKGLYSEGRHAKAMLKENANISWPKRRWGPSAKGTRGWWAEHVQVHEDRIHHGRTEADDVHQHFVHSRYGSSFVYLEVNYDIDVSFTILVDGDNLISDDDWAGLWVRAEQNGLGASRSQGYGKFAVTRFDRRG
jgi:hypothetical protein